MHSPARGRLAFDYDLDGRSIEGSRRIPDRHQHLGGVRATEVAAGSSFGFADATDVGCVAHLDSQRASVGRPVAELFTGLRGALRCVDWLKCLLWAYCVAFWVMAGLVLTRYA